MPDETLDDFEALDDESGFGEETEAETPEETEEEAEKKKVDPRNYKPFRDMNDVSNLFIGHEQDLKRLPALKAIVLQFRAQEAQIRDEVSRNLGRDTVKLSKEWID